VTVTVLVASPLEEEQVARIAAFDPRRVRVIHEPALLADPEYEGQHMGVPALDSAQRARWDELVAQAEVMFDFDAFDPATLATRAPRLRWLQGTSSGIGERLRQSGLLETPIRFTTAAGVHDTALAEFVVLGLLTFTKDLPAMRAHQADRRWVRATTRSLAGTRSLVVGLGAVGGEIARILNALGVEVWGLRRGAGEGVGVRRLVGRAELLDVLPQVDSLVLACPLTEETHHLIGAPELAAVRSSAILVNVARGAVIDEPALVRALSEGRLAGVALDVFEEEPLPAESPLWGMPNVLVSPHSASTIPGENARIVDIFLDNLGRYLEGAPLRNEFDRERGY
jgi:phosphoglycerate dehydrogenase-like enzyme